MKRLLLFFALLLSTAAFSQIGGEDEVYLSNVEPPKFQGGDVTNFHKFVREHFDMSKLEKPGKMVAVFTVTESGTIENLRITEFIDATSAQEFIRVIKSAPKWEPAKNSGKPYAQKITLPLVFGKKR
jgi:protein TonB